MTTHKSAGLLMKFGAFALTCCTMVAAPADAETDKKMQEILSRVGKWICTIDGEVGFQASKDGQRFRGKIRPSKQTFFVHIQKMPARSAEHCVSERARKEHEEFLRYKRMFPGIGTSCLYRFTAEIKPLGNIFYSTHSYSFIDGLMPFGLFNLSGGGTYILSYTNLQGGYYLQEGRCEQISK